MFESDGNILNGTWSEGRRNGDFELTQPDGKVFRMTYDMGRFQTATTQGAGGANTVSETDEQA